MKKLKQWFCGLFGHGEIVIEPENFRDDEMAWYRCKCCNKTWDYYF